jgi:hypothetical protein
MVNLLLLTIVFFSVMCVTLVKEGKRITVTHRQDEGKKNGREEEEKKTIQPVFFTSQQKKMSMYSIFDI